MKSKRVARDIGAVVVAVGQLNDEELMAQLSRTLRRHHSSTAELLAHIGEVDARKLYRAEACSSMFVYCVEQLHMSEPAAYRRIHAARVARDFPRILSMVAAGGLHLSAIKLLAPHLTEANSDELLDGAGHKSKQEVERMLARRFPGEPTRDLVRRVPRTVVQPIVISPAPATAAPAAERSQSAPGLFSSRSPGSPVTTAPPQPVEERYAISFTATRETRDKLRQAQDLMRHGEPTGNLNAVIGRALTLLVEDLQRKRFGRRKRRPVSGNQEETEPSVQQRTRHIPNAVKREVVERDELRCSFIDARGRRCSATDFLELHHKHPFAKGGAHSADNVTVYCATHNRYAAELELGELARGTTANRPRLWRT